jgi:hypothetical protein
MDHIREEITLKGAPRPRIIGLLPGFEETFDLVAMVERHPDAHPGATFQALRARKENVRRFILFLGMGEDEVTHAERHFAVLVEECDRFDGRKWWMGMLDFRADPVTGLGLVERPWGCWPGETNDLSQVDFVLPFVQAPPGAKAAPFVPPPDLWRPDVKMTFGELHPSLSTPTDAKQMVEVAAKMIMNDLLTGKLVGSVILRLSGRSWEAFVVGNDLPDPIEEMVRYVANRRLPQADAVALALFAIQPGETPPVPALQIVAELGGKFAECRAPLEFPDGPKGRPRASRIGWWDPKPVPDGGMWIGVEPNVTFVETDPEA